MNLVRKLEAEEENVRSAMHALKHPQREVIRMGMPESQTQEFMPIFLTDFRRRHPEVDFDMRLATSTRLMELLREDELDVALVFNALMLPGVRADLPRGGGTALRHAFDRHQLRDIRPGR